VSEQPTRISVRSFGAVVDRVERRIYKFDRWRLPTPHGVPVRAIGYGVCCLAVIAVLHRLPFLAAPLDALPWSLHYLALPILGGWGLSAWQIDGRPPHKALRSEIRFELSPRAYAAGRWCPRAGASLAPVSDVSIWPSGDDDHYRPGRVVGPARLVLRNPARIHLVRTRGRSQAQRLANAKRIDVDGRGTRPRALARGTTLKIPRGKEVRFL
jgi:hypothetical protein